MSLLNTTINNTPRVYILYDERGSFTVEVTVYTTYSTSYEYAVVNSLMFDNNYDNPAISWKSQIGNAKITITGTVNSSEKYLFLIRARIEQKVTLRLETLSGNDSTTSMSSSMTTTSYNNNDDMYSSSAYARRQNLINNSGWTTLNTPSGNGTKSSSSMTTANFVDSVTSLFTSKWALIILAAIMVYYFLWRNPKSDMTTTGSVYDVPLLDTPIRDPYRLPQSYRRDALYRTSI